ncbi:undecaprenyl-phosphate glucose phosphotransferase [Pedobacter cryoconitis]|uniref:Undecaprenyl-phosphate galactose phosphotransferase/putative colanic acid biosynthesis UDP-glucose lipid carrier transferase n=1 Tax=Pedobacter cryoconitis TaxID=188932 RepID=A0A327SMW0_9SPHI|nr:undecaprenyl-phosphate glucose phosphotransferase [Pedobacter cryoconitis]RAJ29124.1 undecaprenyl-phosphate galactose phosphotransferase/putative colanic acid biosynthesis UDP-glucose lipid carrier transferase [Pedobacter cryoconitis]
MQTRYLYLLRYVLPVTDLLMLNLVYFAAYDLSIYMGKNVSYELLHHYVIVCNLIWVFNALFFGMYTEYGARRLERIYRSTWRSILMHSVLFSAYLLLEKNVDFSKTFITIFYFLLSSAFLLNRFVGTSLQFLLISKFHVTKKVAVMGGNPTGNRLASYLTKQNNVDFYGIIAERDEDFYSDKTGMISDFAIAEMKAAAAGGVKDLYVSVPPERMSKMHSLVREADKQCLRLKFIPDIAGSLDAPYTMSYMGDEFPIITLRNEPLELMSNRFKKRTFDIIFSGLVILFILSWLYPVIALLIKLQSKGPVLFKQLRSGRNDEPFWCLKFRSMRMNSTSDKKQATKNDDRITPIGKFLRKTSLDELPQFFNVFAGSMTVVGPRPHMLSHTEEYRAIISEFMVRHFMKPGITGWAQVNGFRGETKAPGSMEKRVKHDIWYLENWTAMLDVKILFMTISNVIHGEDNAY